MSTKVKNQVITDRYAIYNDDCMNVIRQLDDKSIDLGKCTPNLLNLMGLEFFKFLKKRIKK